MTGRAFDEPLNNVTERPTLNSNNFAFMRAYEAQFDRLGALAERYFSDDPNTCLIKLRQLAELLAQEVAARSGLF